MEVDTADAQDVETPPTGAFTVPATPNEVLVAESRDAVLYKTDSQCRVEASHWLVHYTRWSSPTPAGWA